MAPMPVLMKRVPLITISASPSMVSGICCPSISRLVTFHVPCSNSRSSRMISLHKALRKNLSPLRGSNCVSTPAFQPWRHWIARSGGWRLFSTDLFHYQIIEHGVSLSTEKQTDSSFEKSAISYPSDQNVLLIKGTIVPKTSNFDPLRTTDYCA